MTMMARKVNEIVSAGIAQKMSLQGGDGFHMHPPADEERNGFMTTADRLLLNNRSLNAIPNSLVQRDAFGRAKVSQPVEPDDIARKEEIDKITVRVDRIVAQSGDDNTEIVDSRGNFPVLSARLNASDAKISDISYNVRAYGALGDGLADDTGAVQAAIEAASITGGVMYFPPGAYVINAMLLIPSNVHLKGAGELTTVLKFGVIDHGITNIDPVGGNESIYLSHFSIDGSDVTYFGVFLDGVQGACINQVRVISTGSHGISLRNGVRAKIVNCTVTNNGGSGVEFVSQTDSIIQGCNINSNIERGIMLQGGSMRNRIDSNDISLNTLSGVMLPLASTATQNTISNNVLWKNSGSGIVIQSMFNTITGNTVRENGTTGADQGVMCNASYNIIANNIITEGKGVGIDVGGGSNISIVGNVVSFNANFGIEINGFDPVNSSFNCTVSNNTVTSNKQDGIRVQITTGSTRNSNNHIISSNRVDGNTGYGITLSSGAGQNYVADNYFTANTAGSVSNSGSGNVFRNNRGYLTESNGTSTIASGSTSVVVNHNLNRQPFVKDIIVTPNNSLGNAAKYWVSNVTATQFTINVNTDPGSGTAQFAWQAIIS